MTKPTDSKPEPPTDDPTGSAGETERTPASAPAPKWTFLTNHTHVLVELRSNPDQVLREVAVNVGITERAVQRIVHELEEAGYLERERIGRRNRYRIPEGRRLRHPIESHTKIDDLLSLIVRPRAAESTAARPA